MAPSRTRLSIRVSPRASRDEVDGFRQGALVVRVTAPPVDSAANDAVVRVLAGAIGVPKRDVSIVRGLRSRDKQVEIAGLSDAQLADRLAKLG